MGRPRAIVFDFNGTLSHDEPILCEIFIELFAEHADVAHLVVTFLALLELSREQLISVAQAEPYAPIYAQLRGETPFALAADAD